jgi:hypothetical protein
MFKDFLSRRDLLAYAGAGVVATLPGVTRVLGAPRAGVAGRPAYERAVLASGPAAYWRLGEVRGTDSRDATGRGHDGRYLGPVELGQAGAIASDPDRSIRLPGPRAKAYVAVPDSNDFSIATSGQGLSVEVWMRPDVLDFPGEDARGPGGFIHWLGKGEKGRYEWGFRFYSRNSARPNRISAYAWNLDGSLGAGAYVEERLKPGVWTHLVATFDDPRVPDARVRFYKDGAPGPHNDSPGTLYKNYDVRPRHGPSPLRLGTRDLHGFLTGGLDEVAVYPRVLGAREIARHWSVARNPAG